MTQYASVTDLGRFGLPASATGDLAEDDLDAQLAAASAEVDSVLESRGYATPLTTWGDDITSCVARIAAPGVLSHLRGMDPTGQAHAALLIAQKAARDWLQMVARGHANPTGLNVARAPSGLIRAFCDVGDDGSTSTRGW